jgi:hypothetical protein
LVSEPIFFRTGGLTVTAKAGQVFPRRFTQAEYDAWIYSGLGDLRVAQEDGWEHLTYGLPLEVAEELGQIQAAALFDDIETWLGLEHDDHLAVGLRRDPRTGQFAQYPLARWGLDKQFGADMYTVPPAPPGLADHGCSRSYLKLALAAGALLAAVLLLAIVIS